MIKEAIEKIIELAGPKTVEIAGLTYSKKDVAVVAPPIINHMEVTTLTAVIEYLRSQQEIDAKSAFVVIDRPDLVFVATWADNRLRRREIPLKSKAIIDTFSYNQWIDIANFIPMVQSMFAAGGDKALLLQYVGNITDQATINVADDGVTQTTQIKKGIARREDVALPQIVTLHPFETFPEIDQPARKFVFRIQQKEGGFSCKMIPADGETWKTAVRQQIAEFLKPKINIPIIF